MTDAATRPRRRAYAPRVPAEQRRTEALDAALHLVATAGQAAVTMEAVAERIGVTKPVVYGVFTSRTELLTTLLRREHEQALAQLLAILPAHAQARLAADPGAVAAELLTEFLGVVRATPDRWFCIVMPMPDMPVEFHAAREQARGVVLDRIAELVRALSPALDAPLLAHAVVALFETAARLTLTDPESFPSERFVTALTATMALARAQ